MWKYIKDRETSSVHNINDAVVDKGRAHVCYHWQTMSI